MPFISAKTILNSINILDEDDVESSKQKSRHPKNEFQAFAYKLSKDLQDDKNLKIYMRLAKNIERSLMERAYSFAIDSNSNEKGRLFLWKLKQLRKEIQNAKDKRNYSYEFVIKGMSKFRDHFAEQTIQKSITWQSSDLLDFLQSTIIDTQASKNSSKKDKCQILHIGPIHPEFYGIESIKNFSIEISGEIVKQEREKSPKLKIIKRDFLKNNFKDQTFDMIILNSIWPFIPLESELKFLSEIKRILKKNGHAVINLKESFEDTQEWKVIIANGLEKEYFIKNETNHSFRSNVEKNDLEIYKEQLSGPYVVYFLRSKNGNENSLSDS